MTYIYIFIIYIYIYMPYTGNKLITTPLRYGYLFVCFFLIINSVEFQGCSMLSSPFTPFKRVKHIVQNLCGIAGEAGSNNHH